MLLDIEKFSNILNNSISTEYKISNWKQYRNNIMKFIKSNIDLNEVSSTAVFATGDAGDISLKFLLNNFKEILLTDISKKLLYKGLQKQLPEKSKKISLKTFDYTGLEQNNFYQKIINSLQNNENIKKIKINISKEMDSINFNSLCKNIKKTYDIIISLPIYTQLFYQHFIAILDYYNINQEYSDEKINNFKNFILNRMPIIINNYNKLLHYTVKNNGFLVALIDMLEYKNSSNILRKIKTTRSNNLIESEIEKHSYGISSYGIDNLKKYFQKRSSKYLVWPFNEKRSFIVKALLFKK